MLFDDLSIIVRTFFMLLTLLCITRILGRRTLSELTFNDFVIGLVIGNITATIITDEEFRMRSGLLVLAVTTIWILAFNMLTLKSVPARKILEAEPIIVVYKGRILEDNLKKRYYNVNDLLEMLREQGTFDPNQVEIALLESDGELSLLKKPEFQTPVVNDLNSQISNKTPAAFLAGTEIIIDGKVITQGLAKSGLTLEQLKTQLNNKGVTDLREITIAMITPEGELYLDKRSDTDKY